MARFTVRIEAEGALPRLAVEWQPTRVRRPGRRPALREWDDPIPKPSYLFALVAGDLRYVEDHHRRHPGREVQLRVYVEPENIDKCDHAMRSLIKAMSWDEEKAAGNVIWRCTTSLRSTTSTWGDGKQGAEHLQLEVRAGTPRYRHRPGLPRHRGVIAHEYFHNWTGNRITCRDWFQLSLKEGFTVYRDQEFSADMGARGVKRIEDVQTEGAPVRRGCRTHGAPDSPGVLHRNQ